MIYYKVGYIILSNDPEILNQNLNLDGLSTKIISLCNNVRPTFPDFWFFKWSYKFNKQDLISNKLLEMLKIDDRDYDEAEKFLTELNERNEFSWPNIFYHEKDAILFKEKYLNHIKNLNIFLIGLPEFYHSDFLQNEVNENTFDVSIYDFINKSIVINNIEHLDLLGFDIAGFSNNQFYSFICNGLQKEFYEYGKKLNFHSLISKYEDADELIKLIDSKTIHAEEILWYPWLLIRCE